MWLAPSWHGTPARWHARARRPAICTPRGPAAVRACLPRSAPGDVDQPVDAEPVGAHAEDVAPRSGTQRHGLGAAGRELVPVTAQLALVRLVAAERDREVVAG